MLQGAKDLLQLSHVGLRSPRRALIIARAWTSLGLGRGLAGAPADVVEEARDLAVFGRGLPQPLRIVERGRVVAGVAAEGDEAEQQVAVLRMPRQALLERRDRLLAVAGGIERDRMHVRVARAVWLELGGALELGD